MQIYGLKRVVLRTVVSSIRDGPDPHSLTIHDVPPEDGFATRRAYAQARRAMTAPWQPPDGPDGAAASESTPITTQNPVGLQLRKSGSTWRAADSLGEWRSQDGRVGFGHRRQVIKRPIAAPGRW